MGKPSFHQEIIETFSSLGHELLSLSNEDVEILAVRALNENPWFTRENVDYAIRSIGHMLNREAISNWLAAYSVTEKPGQIGLVMAGNIPLVGFHDLLCVVASGHHALVKLSGKDSSLTNDMIARIIAINPSLGERISVRDNLRNMDAVIATGSDNSARYFEHYFGKYPHIIRKNRTSAAVLRGNEAASSLQALGHDIFTYFGLGCRNVSKLFVPADYEFNAFFSAMEEFNHVIHHHKYCNNYDFNKSVYLVNKEKHLDNGFLLLKPSEDLVSPVSVIYFEVYNNEQDLLSKLGSSREKIQCIVSEAPAGDFTHVPFGKAQQPELWDYADNVDTMKFLTSL